MQFQVSSRGPTAERSCSQEWLANCLVTSARCQDLQQTLLIYRVIGNLINSADVLLLSSLFFFFFFFPLREHDIIEP